MRGSQRQGFFVVSDVALFVNNSAEIIGCSIDGPLASATTTAYSHNALLIN